MSANPRERAGNGGEEERLPDRIREAMENGVPALLATCSAEGVPNVAVLSRVYYVDDSHVALSFQFFNKTKRNVTENPRACLIVNDIERLESWVLQLEYDHEETEGPLFDEMDMQIEAIASATGMSGIFKLRSADVYRVLSHALIAADAD